MRRSAKVSIASAKNCNAKVNTPGPLSVRPPIVQIYEFYFSSDGMKKVLCKFLNSAILVIFL